MIYFSNFRFAIQGQILNHVKNFQNLTAKIMIVCRIGSKLVYNSTLELKLGNGSVHNSWPINVVTMLWENNNKSIIDTMLYEPQAFYYNITTQSNINNDNVWSYMNAPIVGSATAFSICKIEIVYVGCNLECIQQDVMNDVNNGYITLTSR